MPKTIFYCHKCNKIFYDYECRKRKFCSRSCQIKFIHTGVKKSLIWNNLSSYVEEYKSGATFKEIADKFNVSKCSLQTIFKKASIKTRKEGVRKNNIPWNKGKRLSQYSGKRNGNWKGKGVKYNGLHAWVRNHKGYPKQCILCDKKDHLEWANIDHQYHRNLSDFISLCHWCHDKYDREHHLRKH